MQRSDGGGDGGAITLGPQGDDSSEVAATACLQTMRIGGDEVRREP